MKQILLITLLLLAVNNTFSQEITNLTGPRGTFSLSTAEYVDNLNLQYNIDTQTSSYVQLEITIDTEECCDKLVVYECDENFTNLMQSDAFTTNQGTLFTSINTNGKLVIKFKTDTNTNGPDNGYAGYTVNYSSYTPVANKIPTDNTISNTSTVVIGEEAGLPNLHIIDKANKNLGGYINNDFTKSMLLLESEYSDKLALAYNKIASNKLLEINADVALLFKSPSQTFFSDKICIATPKHNEAVVISDAITFNQDLQLESNIAKNHFYSACDQWVKIYDNTIYLRDMRRSIKHGGSKLEPTNAKASSFIYSHEWTAEGNTSGKDFLGSQTVRLKGDVKNNKWQWAIRYGDYNGREILSVNNENDGRVGINNSNPAYALDVKGTISATEIKVTAQTADFVFEEDYNLRSLNEVNAFIEQNKHLPDVPSASEMEEEGVNIAEMNKILLQKVEELTLYIIDKDNEISELRQELKHNKMNQANTKSDMEKRLSQLENLLNKNHE
ncbi:hypothetical protein [Saccharicrinis aurantiacus]|uniref:hypothetical protein n=1 Tax=Saccharicrinis aurantiacus TaxID=1849719 RepID=UPI0008392296|nr:hypothetical protein [Saccharicrinis aurantiacus]